MPNRLREYYRPPDLPTALTLLQNNDCQPLIQSPRPALEGYSQTIGVVDLAALNLDRISETADILIIGSQTSLQAIIESETLSQLAGGVLAQAAEYAGHLGLRNLATLGGTLASPETSPELHLALLALKAQVVVHGQERRSLPLAEWKPIEGELLLEVNFARPVSSAFGAIARVARSPLDAAIVVAVAISSQQAAAVAVAGASLAPIVKFGAAPEQLVEAVLAAADPVPDYRGSVQYRQAMAGVLAKRALSDARNRRTS